MSVQVTDSADEAAVLRLAGELDAADEDLLAALSRLRDAGHRRIVVDLLNVTFVDSSVVRALVNTHRDLGARGWVRVVYTHHLIGRVLEICGLADLFPQYSTVDAALGGAPAHGRPTGQILRSLDPAMSPQDTHEQELGQ